MTTPTATLSYGSYLKLDELLSAQTVQSQLHGPLAPKGAHDELLFIIVHQTYELWFKQVLHELDAVLAIFAAESVPEKHVGHALHHLERVVAIQRVLIDQMTVLETMTPLDFLEFRDTLGPSSGFQSFQFRAIENKLGLRRGRRIPYNAAPYEALMKPHEQAQAIRPEADASLLERLDAWLARTPFVQTQDFNFWMELSGRVAEMLARDEAIIQASPLLDESTRAAQLKRLAGTRAEFDTVFDRSKYEALRAEGKRSLRWEAFLAALMIHLYRDEPMFQTPFRLLTALVEIDENWSLWRYRHVLMVSRMLGTKIGTGGSSGSDYLKHTVDGHRIYGDLFALSTYLIPRSQLPPLPASVRAALNYPSVA